MNVVTELMRLPGVVAAGRYSYRGDRYSYEGRLDAEMARMASIMCRATTMSVHMEGELLDGICGRCGLIPAKGWAVRGPRFSVCVVANVFCFLESRKGSINDVLHLMQKALGDAPLDMI